MASISSSSSSSSSASTSSIVISYPRPTDSVYVEPNFGEEQTYTKQSSMQDLIQLIQTSGKPLVALAALTSSFVDQPTSQAIHNNQIVYGWKRSTELHEKARATYSLILSVKHRPRLGDFVFFVDCVVAGIHENTRVTVELTPKLPKEGYYCVTHATFNKYMKRILVPVSKVSKSLEDKSVTSSLFLAMPTLTKSQKVYVENLRKFGPASAILENTDTTAKCKALGQEIFDRYKKAGGSLKGYNAALRICNALAFNREGVKIREGLELREAVMRAWEDIGDSTQRWGA